MNDEPDDNILGTYSGTCTNTSINETAKLTLILEQLEDDEITGEIAIYGNLCGGSEFTGEYRNGVLSFVTFANSGKTSVAWTGVVSEDFIEGEYKVNDGRFIAAIYGYSVQKGVWNCSKHSYDTDFP